MVTFPELYQSCERALVEHAATVTMVVTAAIALCTRYTGWSPKQLGDRWAKLPAVVLSVAVYLWVLVGQSGGLSWLSGLTGLVCGLLAGAGSNLAHDGLQAAAKTGTVGKASVVVALLGALGATTGCSVPPKAPSEAELVAMCIEVAPLDPTVRSVLDSTPPEDRDSVLHAICTTAAKQLQKE